MTEIGFSKAEGRSVWIAHRTIDGQFHSLAGEIRASDCPLFGLTYQVVTTRGDAVSEWPTLERAKDDLRARVRS